MAINIIHKKPLSPLAKKISRLCKWLKYVCIVGIFLFPLLNFFYWIVGVQEIHFLANSNWYIQFSDMPIIRTANLSTTMKLFGFSFDLVACSFNISALFLLSRLFGQYEDQIFFSKKNIQLIRTIALILFCQILIFPFYAALRSYFFTPAGEIHTLNLVAPYKINSLLISFGILLFAYISEAAHDLEEELSGVI